MAEDLFKQLNLVDVLDAFREDPKLRGADLVRHIADKKATDLVECGSCGVWHSQMEACPKKVKELKP